MVDEVLRFEGGDAVVPSLTIPEVAASEEVVTSGSVSATSEAMLGVESDGDAFTLSCFGKALVFLEGAVNEEEALSLLLAQPLPCQLAPDGSILVESPRPKDVMFSAIEPEPATIEDVEVIRPTPRVPVMYHPPQGQAD